MTFTLSAMARDIAAAISLCAQIVDANSKIPILRCTRISIDGDTASFTATNTDQTVVARIECEGSGVACIDTAALDAKIKTVSPDARVTFTGDGKSVTITSGRTRWVAPVMIDDFPMQVAKPLDAEPFRVDADYMKAIGEAWSVIDAGHNMLPITGVRLQDKRVIATDGKSARVITLTDEIPVAMILPGRIAPKLAAMFPDGGDLRATETMMSLTTDRATVNSRLVDGVFPDVDRIVSGFTDKLTARVSIGQEALLASIKRAGAIRQSGEKSLSFLNMQLRFRADEIECFARNMDGEEGTDAVAAQRTAGEDCDIGFSGNQLIEEIGSFDAETVEISYGDNRSPIIIRAGNSMRFIQARDFR